MTENKERRRNISVWSKGEGLDSEIGPEVVVKTSGIPSIHSKSRTLMSNRSNFNRSKLSPIKPKAPSTTPKINRSYEDLEEMIEIAMRGDYEPSKLSTKKKSQFSRRTQSHAVIDRKVSVVSNSSHDSRFIPTMREIKYLFEKLVRTKYENEMKPDHEKMMEQDFSVNDESQKNLSSVKDDQSSSRPQTGETAAEKHQNYKEVSKKKLLEFGKSIAEKKPKDFRNKDFTLNFKFGVSVLKEELDFEPQGTLNFSDGILPPPHHTNLSKIADPKNMEKRLSQCSKMKQENLGKKDLSSTGEIKDYYNGNDNYQDDIPFDLYNVVELARRMAKPYTIPQVSDIKKIDQEAINLDIQRNHQRDFNSNFNPDFQNNELSHEFNVIENPLRYFSNKNFSEPINDNGARSSQPNSPNNRSRAQFRVLSDQGIKLNNSTKKTAQKQKSVLAQSRKLKAHKLNPLTKIARLSANGLVASRNCKQHCKAMSQPRLQNSKALNSHKVPANDDPTIPYFLLPSGKKCPTASYPDLTVPSSLKTGWTQEGKLGIPNRKDRQSYEKITEIRTQPAFIKSARMFKKFVISNNQRVPIFLKNTDLQ
ncbi:unnamed protein product [Moneuplotes crassus]|uniref:Uncharacterized protein n=1 Tax=Euplotes crassus TaxID=5936 RepID=A0AAD1Y7Q0_EUPCR|nr:unnamed protein product [Moneuplotes crassus]